MGLILIFIGRICDGLDGAVAKQTKQTDFGGFLDIVLDFAFYGMIPLAFALLNWQPKCPCGRYLDFHILRKWRKFFGIQHMAEKQA